MRLILFLLALLACQQSDAQSAIGGEIRGRTNTGQIKSVRVDSLSPTLNALYVSDSVLIALTRQMKTNDSVSQNLLSLIYQFWRNDVSSADDKVGTRDTILQQVLSTDKLRVTADSNTSRSTVKIGDYVKIDSFNQWNSDIYTELMEQKGWLISSDAYLSSIYGSVVDSVENKLDTIARYNKLWLPAIDDKLNVIRIYEESSHADLDSINNNTDSLNHKLNQIITRVNDSVKVWTTGGFGGGGGGGGGATTIFDSTTTRVSMTVTNLNSLASSATAGWGSDSVTNYRKATDYRINVTLTMSNSAPSSDRICYVYVVPLYNNNGTWETSVQGTTTPPSLTQGTTTIATPNNLRLLGALSYTTQNMILRDSWTLSEIFPVCPEGFKIILINATGSAVAASGNQVNYTPIFKTQR